SVAATIVNQVMCQTSTGSPARLRRRESEPREVSRPCIAPQEGEKSLRLHVARILPYQCRRIDDARTAIERDEPRNPGAACHHRVRPIDNGRVGGAGLDGRQRAPYADRRNHALLQRFPESL